MTLKLSICNPKLKEEVKNAFASIYDSLVPIISVDSQITNL